MTRPFTDELAEPETAERLDSLIGARSGTSVTIGGFDGPHLGHAALFSAVFDAARSDRLLPGVVTFTRSPRFAKDAAGYAGDVSTLSLRMERFRRLGFAFAVLIDFSADFGKMTGAVFFDNLVKTVRMRYLAVGPDFRCGHRLDTGVAEIASLARKEGFRFDSIPLVERDGGRISSSLIRDAVSSADFARAESLLGHPFLLDLTVPLWEESSGGLEAPRDSIDQIVPRVGEYKVSIKDASGALRPAKLTVRDGSVRLDPEEGKTLPDALDIETAEFRLS